MSENKVEFLLIGGYAVGYYGYPRTTGDMDIWISKTTENIKRVVLALKEFGFDVPDLDESLFLNDNIIRMGIPPLRIEIMTKIDGVEFEECFEVSNSIVIDDFEIQIISFDDLIKNKKAAKRLKDLNDVENLTL